MQRPGTGSAAAPDWPARTTQTIESLVATVRDRTVMPATLAAKAVVYGFVIALVGVAITVMFAVAAVRVANVYALRDWESEAIVGGIFAVAGWLLLSRGRAARRSAGKG